MTKTMTKTATAMTLPNTTTTAALSVLKQALNLKPITSATSASFSKSKTPKLFKADFKAESKTDSKALTVMPHAMPTSLNTLLSSLVSSGHGSIEAYISAVNKTPMLSLDEEQTLAKRLRDHDDIDAAQRLIIAHLRLVVSTARNYLGYGLAHADLIQEGNIGLMKAVRRFDPERGVRLVSFALHWIRAEIHEYILKNWHMVKVATTKAQRKLFFNLRSLKNAMASDREPHLQGNLGLLARDVQHIAKTLDVSEADVREMDVRMTGGDVCLDPLTEVGEDDYAAITWLTDERTEPTQVMARKEQETLMTTRLTQALSQLDARSQRIVESRWLADEGQALTLHDLAAEFKVSAERIRQIEVVALKKMRTLLG